ncbi:MAG: ADP-glyceromanno-heptose 6-epimerase [Cyclobacteriaceae bacterium]
MIVVTGAAGFIGSCLIAKLNALGINKIIAVDKFQDSKKSLNIKGKAIDEKVDRDDFFTWLNKTKSEIEIIYHLGARTDTLENDNRIFKLLNLEYSKRIWKYCSSKQIPLVYASSAAVYGNGQLGFSDNHELTPRLKALNPYGQSKLDFDNWVLSQGHCPPNWIGLRFFNVFGPNESHKGRMASMVYQLYRQVVMNQKIRLFKSHKKQFEHGEQSRDFIYVKEVINVALQLQHSKATGIFNVGSGNDLTFNLIADIIFNEAGVKPQIEYIDMPTKIRRSYQYQTKASLDKLMSYDIATNGTAEGIQEYISHYLSASNHW